MKKLIVILVVLLCIAQLNSQAQPQKYIDLSNSVYNDTFKIGWGYPKFSDEFNSLKYFAPPLNRGPYDSLLSNKWFWHEEWANVHVELPSYNLKENIDVIGGSLKLWTKYDSLGYNCNDCFCKCKRYFEKF